MTTSNCSLTNCIPNSKKKMMKRLSMKINIILMAHINPIAVFEKQEISVYQQCDLPNDFELDLFLLYKELKMEM